jgi:SAM-dependent methyltransferase
MDPALISAVERYYTAKLDAHGATPSGVDWNSAAGQDLRFEKLLTVVKGIGQPSINDFGCGYSGLLDYVRERNIRVNSYCGYDISAAMIAEARRRHAGDPQATFVNNESDIAVADFTLASGIFNVRLEHSSAVWKRYMFETVDRMAALSRHGMAFNALTSHSDYGYRRADLFYADPAEMLDYCLRRHSRDVSLLHDYELYEFTIVVRLDGRSPMTRLAG